MEEKMIMKLYGVLVLVVLVSAIFGGIAGYFIGSINTKTEIRTEYVYVDTLDWDKFIYSLAFVESNNNSTAIGRNDNVGLLQITPIMVNEANRIVGSNKYTLGHRLDSLKSIEIFNVVQDYYNSEKSPHKALKIWNSKAPLKYHRDVMNKYNNLK